VCVSKLKSLRVGDVKKRCGRGFVTLISKYWKQPARQLSSDGRSGRIARRVGMVPDEAGTEARADANGDLGDSVGNRGCHCAVHQPGHGSTGSSQL
jgi:hypothetical protein